MRFTKVQGLGNDFVLVNGFAERIKDYNAAAVTLCDRRFGIGADGLLVLLPSETADFRMRIFNSDGSEAEMCGNGIRCFAKYLYEHGLMDKTVVKLETLAGPVTAELQFDSAGNPAAVRVDMGAPRLRRSEIPVRGSADAQVIGELLRLPDGETYRITCVSMGNPHCVIFVDDVAAVAVAEIGSAIENNPLFPCKTNVEFVHVLDEKTLILRVWERGAGITLACGTGACASLVAASLNGKTGRKAEVRLLGGNLTVEWSEATGHVFLTGPAREVFAGEYPGEL